MSIVPLGLGRSSAALQTHRASTNLSANAFALAQSDLQLYAQRQFQHGSDSPFNATATLAIQSQMARKTQNADNLNATQTFLAATSSILVNLNTPTDEAKEMALEALNTATTPTQRNALAQTVNTMLQGIFTSSANYSFGGRYVRSSM